MSARLPAPAAGTDAHGGARRLCARCVLYEGMRFSLLPHQVPAFALEGFHLDDDGVCTLCRAWERSFDAQLVDADLAAFLMAKPARAGAPHAVVALSGGKDSLSALVLARSVYGLPVVAALFDNGFIPADVRAQASAICARLGVELWVDPAPPDFAADLHRAVEGASLASELPCFLCSRRLLARIGAFAAERGAPYVVVGTNYHAGWQDRPRATGLLDDGVTRRIHLPFAARLTSFDTLKNTLAVNAEIKHQRGHSSNCAVPGLVQLRLAPALGHAPEREDLALEVLSGHLPRAEALASLARRGG